MSDPVNDALTAAEVRLKVVRQGLLDFMDAGAGKREPVRKITQGDLERWFDNLECVSGLCRSALSYVSAYREDVK